MLIYKVKVVFKKYLKDLLNYEVRSNSKNENPFTVD